MTHYHDTEAFLIELENFPTLPTGERGEWVHVVSSRWIDGIFWRDRQDPNVIVELCRMANNQPEFDAPVISYEIRIPFTGGELTMTPDAALYLGRHLVEIGAFGVRDLARHARFLSNGEGV